MPKKKYNYVTKTFTHEGQRYFVRGKTEAEAIKKMVLRQQALERGEEGISGKMTVSRWAAEWLETYKKPNVTAKTYDGLLSNARVITNAIGKVPLKDVRDVQLQHILNSRAGHSKSSVTKLTQLMRRMFKQARISRLIAYDPAEGLTPPKAKDGSYRKLTSAERTTMMQLWDTHRAGLYLKIMLYSGLRPGEAMALEWRHVDFDRKQLHIRQAVESGSTAIKSTKTTAGHRDIPIPPELLHVLIPVRGAPFEPVLKQPTTGKRHTHTSIRQMWRHFHKQLLRLMDEQYIITEVLRPLCPYCLRHTYCTDLQDAGVPINVAKYLMGHKSIIITSKIYTHTTDEVINRAAEQITQHNAATG
jgi:integrase